MPGPGPPRAPAPRPCILQTAPLPILSLSALGGCTCRVPRQTLVSPQGSRPSAPPQGLRAGFSAPQPRPQWDTHGRSRGPSSSAAGPPRGHTGGSIQQRWRTGSWGNGTGPGHRRPRTHQHPPGGCTERRPRPAGCGGRCRPGGDRGWAHSAASAGLSGTPACSRHPGQGASFFPCGSIQHPSVCLSIPPPHPPFYSPLEPTTAAGGVVCSSGSDPRPWTPCPPGAPGHTVGHPGKVPTHPRRLPRREGPADERPPAPATPPAGLGFLLVLGGSGAFRPLPKAGVPQLIGGASRPGCPILGGTVGDVFICTCRWAHTAQGTCARTCVARMTGAVGLVCGCRGCPPGHTAPHLPAVLTPCAAGAAGRPDPWGGAHPVCAVVGWGRRGVLALFRGPVQLLQVPKL